MAFNSLSARLEELRSRPPRLHSENTTGTNTPSFRYSGSFMNPPQPPQSADTPNLQRRFTTDLSKSQMPGMTPIGQPPNGPAPTEQPSSMFKKAQLLEKKKQEYEMASEQRKQIQAQLQHYSQQEAREKAEIEQMTQDLQRAGLVNPTYERNFVSEPSTPPERDSAYSSVFSRSNRYSTSSFTSPQAHTRSSRSNSQLASPPSGLISNTNQTAEGLPSKSVPSSRRGSTDRATAFVPETNGSARRNGTVANRYSMPVTSARGRTYDTVPENSPAMDMEQVNTTAFLFDEDDKSKDPLTSPEVTKYLQMSHNNFPVLIRQSQGSETLSASSAALDLALAQYPIADSQSDSNTGINRNQRLSLQHTLQGGSGSLANGINGNSVSSQWPSDVPTSNRHLNRHSVEATSAFSQSGNHKYENGRPSLANAHSSYSTSDVPTLKTPNSTINSSTPSKDHAQQFHNHNASLGRIPPGAYSGRHSRELSGGDGQRDENAYQNLNSALQPGSPSATTPASALSPADSLHTPTASGFNNMGVHQPFYAGYGMQLMNMSMNPMMASPLAYQNPMNLLQSQNNFMPYTNYAQQSRFQDGQPRSMQTRRQANTDDHARFNNAQLEDLQGEIVSLCKDQHGCRYLQKKLEDRSAPGNVQIIFLEVSPYVVELMTDPFGNYLIQKLLEQANDQQRTVLVNNAASDMVKIAFNSHGTRALQKMIEFLNLPEQVGTVIKALQGRVVDLIQDLNGNHVIQKCLNHLSPADAQFIFSAVGDNCVVVGTHRHGCCVLQRCIDHASGAQKAHLIGQITEHSFHLVQDPFGNYVLQYIVDLQEPCFTDPLCETFRGQIPQFSKQKFSSNVIEKCIRGADPAVTRGMIEEMLNGTELEKMLRDSYANYVVQTALDYADPDTKARLINEVRPYLPSVRNTPHGRRISTKIMTIDGQQGRFSGNATPNERSNGQIPLNLPVSAGGTQTNMSGYTNHPHQQYPPPFQQPHFTQYNPSQTTGLPPTTAYPQFGADGMQNFQQTPQFGRLPQAGNFF